MYVIHTAVLIEFRVSYGDIRLDYYFNISTVLLKLNMKWKPRERRNTENKKKNVDGRSTVQAAMTRNLEPDQWEKQRGMAIGFRKTATVVKNTG
jgi:hypothetical protein